MAFQEKSAWVMAAALILGGSFYFLAVNSLTAELGHLAPPILPVVVVYTIILILVAILGHIIVAMTAPKEANAPLDEREQTILTRAGHYSSYLLGAGILLSLGGYLVFRSGDALFYGAFTSLMVSQLMEYVIRIYYYRATI